MNAVETPIIEVHELVRKFGDRAVINGISFTLGENVTLPLMENRRVNPSIIELVVRMKLELVGLTGFGHMKPSELSGAMRKRVGLDPIMTAVIDQPTLDLNRKLEMTAVVVAHDMVSALCIGTEMIMPDTGPGQRKFTAMGRSTATPR